MKEFSTIQDFGDMLKGMHGRGLKLVMDLVVNHSSDERVAQAVAKQSRATI